MEPQMIVYLYIVVFSFFLLIFGRIDRPYTGKLCGLVNHLKEIYQLKMCFYS